MDFVTWIACILGISGLIASIFDFFYYSSFFLNKFEKQYGIQRLQTDNIFFRFYRVRIGVNLATMSREGKTYQRFEKNFKDHWYEGQYMKLPPAVFKPFKDVLWLEIYIIASFALSYCLFEIK